MSREEMIDNIVKRFGYYDYVTKYFIEDARTNSDDAAVKKHYESAILMPTIGEIDD